MAKKKSAAAWTIMYYVNAESDLTTDSLDLISNLAKFPDSDDVNILMQIDRKKVAGEADGWHKVRRYKLFHGMRPTLENTVDQSEVEMDMGDEEVFHDFLEWGITEFPARNTAIVLWSHGTGIGVKSFKDAALVEMGPLKDYPKDIDNFSPEIDLDEMERFDKYFYDGISTLERSAATGRGENSGLWAYKVRSVLKKLQREHDFTADMVIYDSCFMLTFENALELSGFARFLLGSQGFASRSILTDQSFLSVLIDDPSTSPERLSEHIVDNIQSRHVLPNGELDYFHDWFCYSCIDLDKLHRLNSVFNPLIELMLDTENQEVINAVKTARRKLLAYYQTRLPDRFYIGTADLLSFVRELEGALHSQAFKRIARDVKEAVADAIRHNNVGHRLLEPVDGRVYSPTGLCIFFPFNPNLNWEGAYMLYQYFYEDNRERYFFAGETQWDEYILDKISDWF